MIPKQTARLLKVSVDAALNDAAKVLRRAEIRRAEQDNRQGRLGQIAEFAQVRVVYDEYRRRAEIILDCMRKVLMESSFRYYRKLDDDLQSFFVEQCKCRSSDILARLEKMPNTGKPSFQEFRDELHQKLLADVSLASESYLTHHREVIRSWWVTYGRRLFWWILATIGAIIVTLIGNWLTKKYII